MVNPQQPGGLARWEYAIFNAVMFVIPASVLIVLAPLLVGYTDANHGESSFVHLVMITAALVDVVVVSLAVGVALRHIPPVMNLWRVCAAIGFFAYALGSSYELVARELIGHPLPTLEQLAPGVAASLPTIAWVAAIILFGWGVLAALDARRAMQADARQRQPPTPPPSNS